MTDTIESDIAMMTSSSSSSSQFILLSQNRPSLVPLESRFDNFEKRKNSDCL